MVLDLYTGKIWSSQSPGSMIQHPHFCSLPWIGLDINAQGCIKPCCKFSTSVGKDLIGYDRSDLLAQVKQTFLHGGKPEQCKRCWQDEAAGLPSKRQLDHQYVLEPNTGLENVKVIALTFGNICNLACVTCSSVSSSRWVMDERKLAGQFEHLKMYSHDQHYRNVDFIDQIIDRCHDLRHLEISGGEPFYSDRDTHLALLSRIPHPEQVKIHYTTNGTIFPDSEFWNIWRKFRHIDIQLSIDGIEDRFDYLRYPARWTEVWENVQHYRDRTDIQLSISHTVSWLNLLALDDFISWCMQSNLPQPYIGPVSRPAFLSVQTLPPHAKSYVHDRLFTKTHLETQKMLHYMSIGQHDCFDQGIRWVVALDRLRHLDFLSVFPELAPIVDFSTS